jgi:hypothetical protein
MRASMLARAWLKAVAFLLNGGVLLVGVARLQGRLAPQDYVFVGLLLAAPLVSASALVSVIAARSTRRCPRRSTRRRSY